MKGKMMWFNEEKGYGLIRTEDDEQLHVSTDGFRPGEAPVGRCAGLDVEFERIDGDEPRAVDVTFVTEAVARRARARQGSRTRSL